MLEEKIDKLTASIDRLIDTLQKGAANPQVEDKPAEKAKKTKEVKKEPPAKTGITAATFEDIKKATLAAIEAKGRDAVLKILGGYGADKVSEVAEDDYKDLLEKLQNALKED